MRPRKRLHTFFVLLVGIAIGVGITIERISQAERSTEQVKELPVPYEQLQLFSEIYTRVKEQYVEDVDDKKLIESAINGMLSRLDPHSAYLSKDMLREMQVETEGRFGGLGIEVTAENGFIKVVSPIEGTPADKAGLEAGDLIVRIDDTPTKDMTLMEAVKLMRGEPGTDIRLTVVREGFEKPQKFTITRDIIRIESVKSRMLESGIGYVRIIQFQQDTGSKTREAVAGLKDEAGGRLGGLVIDLRNNPGGVLSAAVETADAFVTSGKIVYTEGRLEESRMTLRSNADDVLDSAPIAVLVNGGSASASEIVAGALQDHGRGLVLGTSTFGKGSVQSILELGDGSGLKLTTARYFTPSGTSIQAQGIHPDIVVEPAEIKPLERQKGISEASLAGHLENTNGDGADAGTVKSDKSKGAQQSDSRVSEDNQLYEALNILKGIDIFRQ